MARERELPLVLAVDCCRDDALERDALAGVARFRSVSSEDEACASLVEEATVLVVRTASPQPPVVARAVFMPALVVALGSPDAAAETAAARRAGATRFLHAPLDATDALADTAATLALDGARRTHRLAARLRDGGAWSPPPEELRGARRVKDLTVGLVGIDAVAAGVARRLAAFGARVVACDPAETTRSDDANANASPPRPAPAPASAWTAVLAAGATRAASLASLLAESDVLSLHAPSSHDPRVFALDDQTLRALRPRAVVVSTLPEPRALVDVASVAAALAEGRLGAAAIRAPDFDARALGDVGHHSGAKFSAGGWTEAWVRETPGLVLIPAAAAEWSDDADSERRMDAARKIRAFLRGDEGVGERLDADEFGFGFGGGGGVRFGGGFGGGGGGGTSLVLDDPDEDEALTRL